MFLLLKAKLRLALRIPVCCFPILSPLDFLADVQDKMFLPLVPWQQSGFIRSFRGASNAILPRPGWWCPPSAVMLCTESAAVVTISLIINPSHPSFRGLAGAHVDQCCALHPCIGSAVVDLVPGCSRCMFPAVLRHLLSQINGEALKWADSAAPLAWSLCSSQINVPSKAEPLQLLGVLGASCCCFPMGQCPGALPCPLCCLPVAGIKNWNWG